MERLPKAPAPLATANGIKPLIKAKEVIRIGRKRLVAPWMAAPDDNGNLLNFFDWEKSGWMMGFDVDLTGDYHTVVQPLDHPENYVCIFFMKDSQGNTSYSEMIPLK